MSGHCCTFVPPYLLRELASRVGMVGGASAAEQTLRRDADLRRRRATSGEKSPRSSPEAPAPTGRRIVYDAGNTFDLPGRPARRDEDPATGDVAVDEAHASAGQVWDLFAGAFGRESYDGDGSTAQVTVHYGVDYDNAFWDGSQLVFGDGDGEIFDRFTKPMDVMAHEFTHGVVQYTANLVYSGQSGALNESVADVFASMTKQQSLQQSADQADWLIGVGLFLPGVQAKALRSMTEPGTAYDDPRLGKDPQVGSMTDYVETDEDNGGVHINSGIPNRAFALAARTLGGFSWERAGRVWYDALVSGEVGSEADFAGFARATVSSAARVFADDPAVGQAVVDAWTQVGVLSGAAGTAAALPTPAKTGSPASSPDRGERSSAGGAATGPSAEKVAVRRTGGFAGAVRTNELDLVADPMGEQVRQLLHAVDLTALSEAHGLDSPAPDRFSYTVEYGEVRVTVAESQLGPELSQVVQIVLGQQRHDL